MDVSDIIKPSLARGELQAIGATTIDEYEKYIKKDEALSRRFQLIKVKEPTVEQTVKILQGIKEDYQDHHRVEFSDESIKAAAKLADTHIKSRLLPDKAIDLLDETGAAVHLRAYDLPNNALKLIRAAAEEVHKKIKTAPENIKELLKELEQVKIQEKKAVEEEEKQKHERKIMEITAEIEDLQEKAQKTDKKNELPLVKASDVKRVLDSWKKENNN